MNTCHTSSRSISPRTTYFCEPGPCTTFRFTGRRRRRHRVGRGWCGRVRRVFWVWPPQCAGLVAFDWSGPLDDYINRIITNLNNRYGSKKTRLGLSVVMKFLMRIWRSSSYWWERAERISAGNHQHCGGPGWANQEKPDKEGRRGGMHRHCEGE